MSTPLLSAKLVELRQQKGCSQQEIADYLGVTREAYSHYERSTREPNLEMIVKLTKFYDIEISELINDNTIPIATQITTGIVATKKASLHSSHGIAMSKDDMLHGALGGGAIGTGIAMGTVMLSNNIHHFLKLFTGKNKNLNLTNITKEDIAFLAQYKKLNAQDQKEVRQYIKFKHSQHRKK